MRISDWSSDVCSSDLTHHTMLHEAFKRFLGGFRHDAHPMSMLVGMLGSMASFYHNDTDYDDPEQRRLAAIRLIATLPTIAAACHRHSVGWPLRYPRNNLGYRSEEHKYAFLSIMRISYAVFVLQQKNK